MKSNFTEEAMAKKTRQGRQLTFADEATPTKPATDLCRTEYSENLHYSYLNGGQGEQRALVEGSIAHSGESLGGQRTHAGAAAAPPPSAFMFYSLLT